MAARYISIHAPREGSDFSLARCIGVTVYFYPRSPRGERRRRLQPGRRLGDDFYPRSPRGERQAGLQEMLQAAEISIHAPREGSDVNRSASLSRRSSFLSTLPARGATADNSNRMGVSLISIHAPREGSDQEMLQAAEEYAAFLSTLPARGATSGA